MNDHHDSYQDDLDELLSQVDELFPELREDAPPRETEPSAEFVPSDDFDPDEYAPADALDDEPMVFHNYSNRYGADIRNFSNGYGTGVRSGEQERPAGPVIPAYNADFKQPAKQSARQPARERTQKAPEPSAPRSEYRDYGGEEEEEVPVPPTKTRSPKKKKAKKRRGCGCGCTTILAGLGVVVIALVLVFNWIFAMPKSDDSIGPRKSDTAAILIAGTDKDGTRTDTIMLLYLSGSEKKASLISLPRDTYTITSSGSGAKLNSAYGRNGTGEEGMEGLLDYVQEIIGYRPDGYILVDMTIVPQIVDLMGGVDVEVPQEMYLEGVTIPAGYQHLDGTQVLTVLRYRSGYANADLGRIEVQRAVLKACMEQWLTAEHISAALDSVKLIESSSISSLNLRNYLWMGKNMLLGMKNLESSTLPGYATYIGDASYYVLYRDQVAELINESCNPYKTEILAEDLKIAG